MKEKDKSRMAPNLGVWVHLMDGCAVKYGLKICNMMLNMCFKCLLKESNLPTTNNNSWHIQGSFLHFSGVIFLYK